VSRLLQLGSRTVAECIVDLERRQNLPNKKRARTRLLDLTPADHGGTVSRN